MRIHWFNPENDVALASGIAIYTPPKAAREIRRAGALLPLWYGAPGDEVLCDGVNDEWYERLASDFGITVDIFAGDTSADAVPDPWGWSAYARHRFLAEGFLPETMPTPGQIVKIRELSHRRTAARMAKRLAEALPGIALTAPAIEVSDADELARIIATDEHLVLKTPWSSSGRGVVFVKSVGADRAVKMGADSIRRQGSVMVEHQWRKVMDFARLFECRDGSCVDLGTSVFTTDSHGAYTGNLLAPEPERLARVGQCYPADRLLTVCAALREIIEQEIAPYYNGVLGVDMLVTADGVLDAVVEINMRKTMGYVANTFADRYLHPGAVGEFIVGPLAGRQPYADDYACSDHRISHGILNLTPPNRNFAFFVKISNPL